MSPQIFKYIIPIQDDFQISMPYGAKILCVQVQCEKPCVWALVDTECHRVKREFRIVGTGHPFEDAFEWTYVATFQLKGGALVFHLFSK